VTEAATFSDQAPLADRETAFDRQTGVEPCGPERFSAQIDAGWWVERGAHGGYLAAIVLRAMRAAVDDPARRIRSLTIHYAGAAQGGEAQIECRLERAGRSLSTVSARLEQEGRLIALALAAFSTPWPGALQIDDIPAPVMPPAGEIEPLDDPGLPRFTRHFEYRFALGPPPFSGGPEAETGGWMRLAEPRPLDEPLLVAFADGWLPALLCAADEPVAVPTIDYTVHFRHPIGAETDSTVKVFFRTQLVSDGFFEEDGLIWDQAGRLLVQCRQLGLALPR
jgi:acyl-CoA thioesterase